MKKILIAALALAGIAFLAPDSAQAGGHVSVSFGLPIPAPVVVYPSGGYYCAPQPIYYAPRQVYYNNCPPRVIYRGNPYRYNSGYSVRYRGNGNHYRGRRHCD